MACGRSTRRRATLFGYNCRDKRERSSMGVLMQAFYWYSPRDDNREYKWWEHVRQQVPALAAAGFTSLWLPPIHKCANLHGPSMGYDPYDYYDIGEYDQKGSVPTWFGSKEELLDLIREAHARGLTVLADMVINHNAGADAQELNPITQEQRWTLFQPKSGRFPRNWECFTPNQYEAGEHPNFGDFPDLSHANPYVRAELLALARWMIEDLGFDGFRYDFAKGYTSSTIRAMQDYPYRRNGRSVVPHGIAEFWEWAGSTLRWLESANLSASNPVHVFDFALREMLKALCDEVGFSLTNIPTWETVLRVKPEQTVTFVESHDLRDAGRPIIHDKLLAYSFILTHEGHPCIYWKDYFNHGLALRASPNGIDALVEAHERFAGGETRVLHVDDDLYIMERGGDASHAGLVYVLNNRGDDWRGAWVSTQWPNTGFRPVAWWGRMDMVRPIDQSTGRDGRGQFFAPPRGFAVYVPRGG
jgi:alpha-amylase